MGDATFAFLVLATRGGAASVVGVRVGAGGEATVVSRPLTATDFTDRSSVDAAVLAGASRGPVISRLPGEGLVLRLDFASRSAAVQGRTARLRLW